MNRRVGADYPMDKGWDECVIRKEDRRQSTPVEDGLLELLRECRTAMDIASGHCGPLGHEPAELARHRLTGLIAQIDAYQTQLMERGAHDDESPEYWRGNDAGVAGTVRQINKVLDSGKAGNYGSPELTQLAKRIESLQAELAERPTVNVPVYLKTAPTEHLAQMSVLAKELKDSRAENLGLATAVNDLEAEVQRYREVLAFIASQEDYTFAECSLAEEIIGRANTALTQED